MKYERFVEIVQREARVDRQTAEKAVEATLRTLADRLSEGQAKELVAELPDDLAKPMRPHRPLEPFDSGEFLRRVAEREEAGPRTAEQHARAVFYALSRAVTAKTFSNMASELPKDFRPLMEKTLRPPGPVMPTPVFLSRVADRAGVDLDTAWRATDAVLTTLAERLAGGEVEDLKKELPFDFHVALDRGIYLTGMNAISMSLDAFLTRVAESEGISSEQAREHARAVISTVRDAVVEKEFRDLTSELPREFVEEFAHA